jgi:hypothetical protein
VVYQLPPETKTTKTKGYKDIRRKKYGENRQRDFEGKMVE